MADRRSAPLDAEALAASLAPFGASRTLPGEAYTSPDVFAWELRQLFAGTWTCLGRVDELRADELRADELRADELRADELRGDDANQRAATVGDVGVLLTFDGFDGETIRGFANVCRHRGHELLPSGGAARRDAVVCPYHGWAYRLDGSLATATAMDRERTGRYGAADFDRAEHGLVELPVVVWRGWLFVNLLISAHPDYVMTHRLLPVAPGRTDVECSWYFPPGVTDPAYAVDFWDVTNRQDWAACESVQRGVASPHFRPGPLAPDEDAVYQWTTLVARVYLDPVAAIREACTR